MCDLKVRVALEWDFFRSQNVILKKPGLARVRPCKMALMAHSRKSGSVALVPLERIERKILLLRGHKVMLDADLAALYGVATKALMQAAKRNPGRFPADFMFQLTPGEAAALRSQFVTSKPGRGGRRYAPFVFTEQGVAMLSSVLRSKRAIEVNVQIMRAFVKLRQLLASHASLARKLAELESKYDSQFKIVFEAIRELMVPPKTKRGKIGF
jgi:hypothetical protein